MMPGLIVAAGILIAGIVVCGVDGILKSWRKAGEKPEA